MGSTVATSGSRVLRRVAAALSGLALLATLACGAGWLAVDHLAGNITTLDLTGQLGDRPTAVAPAVAASYPPVNLLVMGTDTRTGQGRTFGSAADTSSGSGHSDTVILLHISGDRTRALGVSIPRDSWVTRPACGPNSSGQFVTGKFNAAFAAGGPACTIKAVEYLTHVRIDHFVVVNFLGFQAVVNALGGVPICLTHPVNDIKSHFTMSAGTHVLNGTQALAFARLRHHIGDGSDIGREDRQQVFMSSVVRTATSKGVLTNPVKLYSVVDAVTKSLTVDPGLGSLDDLKNFAESMSGLTPSMVRFMTVPWTPRSDGENVLWDTTKADQIWQAFRRDTPYPPASSAGAASQAHLTVAPKNVSVVVLNGSGVSGAGRQAADQLSRLGYHVVSVGNAPTSGQATTSISAGSAASAAARTLQFSMHGAPVTTGTGSALVLTVGKDWAAPRSAHVTTAPAVSSNSTVAATQIKSADQASCVG